MRPERRIRRSSWEPRGTQSRARHTSQVAKLPEGRNFAQWMLLENECYFTTTAFQTNEIPHIQFGFRIIMVLYFKLCTSLFIHSSVPRFWREEFGEFPWLVGRYCSYLLPKQALATLANNSNKTLRQTGWIALYQAYMSFWSSETWRGRQSILELRALGLLRQKKEVPCQQNVPSRRCVAHRKSPIMPTWPYLKLIVCWLGMASHIASAHVTFYENLVALLNNIQIQQMSMAYFVVIAFVVPPQQQKSNCNWRRPRRKNVA